MPRRVTQTEAVEEVERLARTRGDHTCFVGVDGPGGAGKSTLAGRLAAAVPGAVVVSVDDFSGPRVKEWGWRRFNDQLVRPLRAGRVARYQRWNWQRDEGGDWVDVSPGGVVIVEGVSATRDEADVAWALTIWVETGREVRLARALERDGASMMPRWVDDWIPSEEAYIAAQRPEARADLIVSGEE
jgi:uridine kinase